MAVSACQTQILNSCTRHLANHFLHRSSSTINQSGSQQLPRTSGTRSSLESSTDGMAPGSEEPQPPFLSSTLIPNRAFYLTLPLPIETPDSSTLRFILIRARLVTCWPFSDSAKAMIRREQCISTGNGNPTRTGRSSARLSWIQSRSLEAAQ